MTISPAFRRKLARARQAASSVLRGAVAHSESVFFDLLLIAGGALFAYGAGLAWRPLGFISAGALLIAFALFAGPADKPREREG